MTLPRYGGHCKESEPHKPPIPERRSPSYQCHNQKRECGKDGHERATTQQVEQNYDIAAHIDPPPLSSGGGCSSDEPRKAGMPPPSAAANGSAATINGLLLNHFNAVLVVDDRPAILSPFHEPELRPRRLFEGVAVSYCTAKGFSRQFSDMKPIYLDRVAHPDLFTLVDGFEVLR